jgi:anti-sigma regulatory factor (Ser/Thr protein kinase)
VSLSPHARSARAVELDEVLAASPPSVALARKLVRVACSAVEVDEDVSETVVLLTSEAVTNALTHGHSEIRLHVHASTECVRVEVGDDNSRHPRLRPPDEDALDGRGLQILQVAADRWGVRPDQVGKTVWFEVEAPAP